MNRVQRLELEIEDALRDHERYKGYVHVQRYRSNMRSIQAKRAELQQLRLQDLENIPVSPSPEVPDRQVPVPEGVPVQVEVEVKRVPFNDYLQNVICYRCNRRGHYAPSCRVKDDRALVLEQHKLEQALKVAREVSLRREKEIEDDRKRIMENYHRYFLTDSQSEAGRKRRRVARVLRNLS